MTILEKTAYIKGLCEGLELDKKDTAEAKIIKALIDLCNDMAEEIECLGEDVEDLIDYCEELDEDLGDVEEVLLDEDEYDEDEEEYLCGCGCDCEDCDCDCEGEDCEDCECYGCECDCNECEFGDDDDFFEIVCPSCGETVCFDESVNEEELVCPACGSELGCIIEDDDINPAE